MKQHSNNEVDLLLRSLAQGRDESALGSGSASGGGNGTFPDHLDADELNSYAEGVVPAPARARYTEHLADCEVCRRLVVDLTQAAGTANRLEVPDQHRVPGFWQKLAALFSPAVLRYAVPALVLTAVIAIGLLALRQERQGNLVARNEPPAPATATDQTRQTHEPTANSTKGLSAPTPNGIRPPEFSDSVQPKRDQDESLPAAAKSADTAGEFGATVPAAKSDAPGKDAEVAKAQPSYAPEPNAGAPVQTGTLQSQRDNSAVLAKEQPAKREDERQRAGAIQDDGYRRVPSEEHGPNRSAAPRSALPADSGVTGNASVGRAGPRKEDKKTNTVNKAKAADVETRSVSGRHFSREGNAWVDTAYEFSQATTNVSRSSEQFRALVADEPGLRAIADQLRGVVIVVWKNRAYRIQ